MINRINLILKAKNITAKQFAEEIGIQPSGMSHILGGRNNPSLDFALKVLRRYPEIDANWLILGKGEMYASGSVQSTPLMQPSLFMEPEVAHPSAQPVSQPIVQTMPDAPQTNVRTMSETPQSVEAPSQPVNQQVETPPAVEDVVATVASSTVVSAPEQVAKSLPKTKAGCVERKVVKVLFIYDDNSFDVMTPRT